MVNVVILRIEQRGGRWASLRGRAIPPDETAAYCDAIQRVLRSPSQVAVVSAQQA